MRSDTAKIIVAIICLLTAGCDDRTESASTPTPKPEVWGAMLPVPEGEEVGGSEVFETPEGDVVVRYATLIWDDPGTPVSILYYNFSKSLLIHQVRFDEEHERRHENWSGLLVYERLLNLKEAPRLVRQWLRDGRLPDRPDNDGNTYLVVASTLCRWKPSYVVKFDAEDRVILKKTLVRYRRQPELTGDCVGETREIGLRRIDGPYPLLHLLSDGTLLYRASDDPLTIRLRPDFTSPFIDESDDLLMLDADPFLAWVEECRVQAMELAELYGNAAARLPPPDGNDNVVPLSETADTCLALRLAELVGAKRALRGVKSPASLP
jgi:hypothetical protein